MGRFSEYRGRELAVHESVLERFAMSAAGQWYLRHLAPRIDRFVIPRTHGRITSMGVGREVGLLTTTGARSGQRRTTPVTLLPVEDEALLAIASNYGGERHPAWSHNLLAHPTCTLDFWGGEERSYDARLLEGEERADAWATITDFYRGYAVYEETAAPRVIRVFRLTPTA